jgi:hypothetical protein
VENSHSTNVVMTQYFQLTSLMSFSYGMTNNLDTLKDWRDRCLGTIAHKIYFGVIGDPAAVRMDPTAPVAMYFWLRHLL